MKRNLKLALFVMSLIMQGSIAYAQTNTLLEINLMKVNDKKDRSNYVKLIKSNLGEVRELAVKEKYILSYKILQDTSTKKETQWDVMLVTEYGSKEQMDKFFKDYSAMSKRARPNGSLKIDGKNFPDLGKSIYYTVLLNDQTNN